jgi:YD repeat-containing protein
MTQSGFTPTGDPVNRTTTKQYNTSGQVIQIDGPRTDVLDITTFEYYACTTGVECGQLKKVTDALGHSITYDSYSPQGVTQTTDANGLKTHYTYDTKGRVKTLTQTPPVGASRQTQYTYDPNGQVIQTVLPDGMTLTYTYDAAHYLRSITDNLGNKVEYTYDLKGRRTQELTKDPDGTLVRSLQTGYDIRDKVAAINAGGSLTQQLRDALGNLVKETDPNNQNATNPVSTTYNYDPLNRLLKTVDRLSGPTTYGYDSNDRPIAITAPNGITTRYVYDDLGNLLQEQSPQRGIRCNVLANSSQSEVEVHGYCDIS